MIAWRVPAAAATLLCLAASGSAFAGAAFAGLDDAAARGESIYLRGVTASGANVQASHVSGGPPAKGRDTACVNCHQHSGLGATEGHVIIPPITGRYLFQPRSTGDKHATNLPYVEGMHRDRDPYTDATLAHAIRDGVDAEGRTLGYLMPRFALGEQDMSDLIAYLKKLDPHHVPGVTDSILHFATIITPDADPVKKQGMLSVMEQYFADKNTRAMKSLPHMHTTENTMYSRTMYMTNRRWQLHVWELKGPADSWQAQLEDYAAKEPVFAVISGLGAGNWQPVADFCEREHMPCLFPNVEVPVVQNGEFYTMYFSKGVLLEAGLIADAISDSNDAAPIRIRSVRQVYRAGDSGERAAKALSADLATSGIVVHDLVLPGLDAANASDRKGIDRVLHDLAPGEALVLWLRPADVAALGPLPEKVPAVYLSSLLGGLDQMPLPVSWRQRAWLAYPFDLPDRRVVRVDYALGWFRIRKIPVVAEQVQSDTYLALGLLSETLSHMVDTFVRDYLVERMEDDLEHRLMTGYYPRLTLSQTERFASKGGYVVRFAGKDNDVRVVAAHDWMVPQ
jgi:hypothetical protein